MYKCISHIYHKYKVCASVNDLLLSTTNPIWPEHSKMFRVVACVSLGQHPLQLHNCQEDWSLATVASIWWSSGYLLRSLPYTNRSWLPALAVHAVAMYLTYQLPLDYWLPMAQLILALLIKEIQLIWPFFALSRTFLSSGLIFPSSMYTRASID